MTSQTVCRENPDLNLLPRQESVLHSVEEKIASVEPFQFILAQEAFRSHQMIVLMPVRLKHHLQQIS